MFCPVCKVEYRPGFTRCSDCGVPLVDSLATARQSRPELLWTGTDQSLSEQIRAALDSAEIPHHHTRRDFDLIPGVSPGVEAIFVPGGDAEAAHRVLDQVRSEWESGRLPELEDAGKLPTPLDDASAENSQPDDAGDYNPGYVPDDFDPESATAEIWTGADLATRDMLIASLRENGIGCAPRREAAVLRLAVLPRDESRAREIVREVINAAPPE